MGFDGRWVAAVSGVDGRGRVYWSARLGRGTAELTQALKAVILTRPGAAGRTGAAASSPAWLPAGAGCRGDRGNWISAAPHRLSSMSSANLSLEYDPQADAVYVWLAAPGTASQRTEAMDDARAIDYDDGGRAVGVEFLGVSRGIDLDGVPEADAITSLLAKLPAIKAVA